MIIGAKTITSETLSKGWKSKQSEIESVLTDIVMGSDMSNIKNKYMPRVNKKPGEYYEIKYYEV